MNGRETGGVTEEHLEERILGQEEYEVLLGALQMDLLVVEQEGHSTSPYQRLAYGMVAVVEFEVEEVHSVQC